MNPREFAKKRTTLSELMQGREKAEMEALIGEELTLINAGMVQIGDKDPFAVCIFQEYPNNFVFAGQVMSDLVTGLILEYGEQVEEELKKCNGIPLKFEKRKSKESKFEYVAVVILDEKTGGKK